MRQRLLQLCLCRLAAAAPAATVATIESDTKTAGRTTALATIE